MTVAPISAFPLPIRWQLVMQLPVTTSGQWASAAINSDEAGPRNLQC